MLIKLREKIGMSIQPLGNQPPHAMIINEWKVIAIFCETDDFVQGYERFLQGKLPRSRKIDDSVSCGSK